MSFSHNTVDIVFRERGDTRLIGKNFLKADEILDNSTDYYENK